MKAAETGTFDAVICLGVVIRGETPHFDYVAGQAAAGIMQASMDTGIPVMFGVVTADTVEQAQARCGGDVRTRCVASDRSPVSGVARSKEAP